MSILKNHKINIYLLLFCFCLFLFSGCAFRNYEIRRVPGEGETLEETKDDKIDTFEELSGILNEYIQNLSQRNIKLTHKVTKDIGTHSFDQYTFEGQSKDHISIVLSYNGNYKEHYESSTFGWYSPTSIYFEQVETRDEYCIAKDHRRYVSIAHDEDQFETYGNVLENKRTYERNYYWEYEDNIEYKNESLGFFNEGIQFYLNDLIVTMNSEIPFEISQVKILQNRNFINFSYLAKYMETTGEIEEYNIRGLLDIEKEVLQYHEETSFTRINKKLWSRCIDITVEENLEEIEFASQDYELSVDAKY